MYFETSEFHKDTLNRYLRLGCVSIHNPCNAISNVEQLESYKAFRIDQVLLCATSLSNICPRGYALTVDAIKNQLPSRNEVSFTLVG